MAVVLINCMLLLALCGAGSAAAGDERDRSTSPSRMVRVMRRQRQHKILGDSASLPQVDSNGTNATAGRDEGLTLVVMDYSRKRSSELRMILKHYQSFDRSLIEEIVVVWNNASDSQTPQELQNMNEENKVPIRVEVFGSNSMNNRFAVGEKIKTQGVVVTDNDLYLNQSNLSCLVRAWRQQPSRLFGAWSQSRGYTKVSEDDYQYQHHPPGNSFSFLLPHPWVVKTDYLRMYMKNSPMLDLVDNMTNCEEILFNAVVANMTGAPPIAYEVEVHKTETWYGGLSSEESNWFGRRNQCLQKIHAYFMASHVGEYADMLPSGTGPAHCSDL